MKKTLLIIAILTLITSQSAFAASKTPTPTPTDAASATDSADMSTIEKIKQMVANKVSQLKLVEKKGIMGTVTEVSNTQITINTSDQTQQFIDIDELTKFQDSLGSSQTFGISDIKSGNVLAFIGNYNKDSRRLLARFVTKVSSIPLNVEGVVSDKDTRNFNLIIVGNDGIKKTISVQSSTKTYSYDPSNGEQKSGFSKTDVGQRIIAVGFQDPNDKNTLDASRITILTNIPPSEGMIQHADITLTPTQTPSK